MAAWAASPAAAAVPAPGAMATEVIVNGRTSTVVKVDTACVGQEIPDTFSGDRVHNTPGFAWWVSKHWALKTDTPAKEARLYLELLEQAYPHYVALFGREVPGLTERRMTACYASTKDRLRQALAGDGIAWDSSGGGITYEGTNCAYAYPSGALQYHQRYILLHECTHLYQQLLWGSVYNTPPWYYEGLADALASHVYDSAARRLTVQVLDKPTSHDYFDEGLAELARVPLTAEAIHDGAGGRGVRFLLVHYLSDDPDRSQKFRLYREALPRRAARDRCLAESSRLMQELFGPWSRINADFRAWLGSIHNTFHYAQWGWEQDGEALISYGYATDGRPAQTDLLLAPAEKSWNDRLRMDYPHGPVSPLAGVVARGVAEPSVGCLVDFSRTPGKGRAGLGLGVVAGGPPPADVDTDAVAGVSGVRVITIEPVRPAGPAPGYVSILINEEREVVMDATAVGSGVQRAPLPKIVIEAAAAGGRQFGLNVRIAAAALEVTVRARDPKAAEPVLFRTAWPLAPEVRERLMKRPMAVLSRDGRHGVTPYIDDPRWPDPDFSVPAPPNRWRSPGDLPLAACYRAAWRLKDKTPASLAQLKADLLSLFIREPDSNPAVTNLFGRQIARVLKDVATCGAPPEVIREVMADLEAMGG
jgi:hypothetical protein